MGTMETSIAFLMLRRFTTCLALLVSSTRPSIRQDSRHQVNSQTK